ncbi:disintegrin and metalloproteinase domain-containing protein 19 [Cephus cinctus]|uniref:Disintegrin and metalloproteinase domain-containing protein 19 n=2 Tax=Hymenoptera TaxID=7399 RepID=A0AAJ7CD69_CEPCN|nr:disintegrin and metalloproteinase domain-containing protein 19 [Cephus cinctus]
MFWVHCGLFVLVIAVPGFISSADSTAKREVDYTLDESMWNEETPAGEVERLLREYRQNQELVTNIGGHYYQIIYPVQLRHHEKMGISTREAGFPKFSQSYGDGYQSARGRSRTGKHFHRTSLLIKAFNHKFRLDLELNTQLLAPNLSQKGFLPSGAEQISKQEIEHCYYHGTVKDYPGASAAFHTCNGVSGVIHLGNETFVIHPFYGGDLSQKHPHVIFEARTKASKGCANSQSMEWRLKNRRQKHVLGFSEESIAARYKRDVREATKYIETAIVIDKAMFDKRNGSTRTEVIHDAIQVANIADLYFRTLNTRVSVVYIETWQGGNQAAIDRDDIGRALQNFNDYSQRKMFQMSQDTIQLLTGENFKGDESGMAMPETLCTRRSVGISVDLNTYEPHLLAGTMAHMIGHNIGMNHDDGRGECCRDWHGCIMAKSIVGLENVQPYKFSECSKNDYTDALKGGHGLCLFNKPNEVEVRRSCGNRVIDDGEECDCGTIEECQVIDPCCDPITCRLVSEAECATGPCCNDCKLRVHGVICRESTNECDLPEVCSGETGQCPVDVYKKNGSPCSNNEGFCFNGVCPALDLQCEQVWGYGGIAAVKQCFEEFNSKGAINGHCGTDTSGHFIKCETENVKCGSLQCQMGSKEPVISGVNQVISKTVITAKGQEYECKTTSGTVEGSEMPGMGLVRDGTSCGDNLICVNQTCTSLFPHVDQGKCPSNHNNNECSGNGVCTNANKCHCDIGWSGPDCSIQQDIPTTGPTTSSTALPGKSDLDSKIGKKITPYENYHGSNTIFLVGMLMSVVGGVFVVFALMALCYRSVVVHKNFSLCLRKKSTVQKYDAPYSKKPAQKSYGGASGNHHPEVAALDSVNKILTFGSMPSYSRGETQRVLFRPLNNVATADGTRLKEHKPQMKRMGVDEEDGGTGAEEVVSFIDLPPNSLTKLPEKGILKKHGGYGIAGGTISEMERTLNSLNGYHENIIEALRNAATHRGLASTPSGSSNLLSEDALHKSLVECGYPDVYPKDGQDNTDNQDDEDDEDVPPSCGPIRIRNLEDLIRQLEHHSARHMSPSGSEDIRISEIDGDRHYRIDSSVCSESSQGSRRCSRGRDDDSRFVYGRYRQPTARSPYGTHQHAHQHAHQLHEEEGIYETADPDRGSTNRGETPDSESDAFIQAQQQLARWTSENEEGVQHRPPQQPPPVTATQQVQQHQQRQCEPLSQLQRGYYPSPPHSESGQDSQTEAATAQSQEPDSLVVERIIVDTNHRRLPNVPKKKNHHVPLLDDNNINIDCTIMSNGSSDGLITATTSTTTEATTINNIIKNTIGVITTTTATVSTNDIITSSTTTSSSNNNTSDNENTALLPPSHFPEYKH